MKTKRRQRADSLISFRLSKLLKRTCAITAIIALLFTGTFTFSSMAHEHYHIQLKTFGVTSPAATSSPITIELGQSVNVGAEVANQSGYEVTESDPDFGDEYPVYERIHWEAEDSEIVGINPERDTTHVSLTGKRVGSTNINISYPGENNIDGLTIRVEVVERELSPEEENKVLRFDIESQDISLTMPERSQELTFTAKGYNDKSLVPNLRVKEVPYGSDVAEAHIDGNKFYATGLREGNALFVLCDETNEEAVTRVKVAVKDSNIFEFDADTNTIVGFRNPKTNPTEIDIPSQLNGHPVLHIGPKAFNYSKYNLGKVIQNPLTRVTLPEGLLTIGKEAFKGNSLTEIRIPASVSDLGERSFSINSKLSAVNFASGSQLEEIPKDAFQGASIKSISLPESIKRIKSGAFNGTKLRSINLPNGLTEIGGKAFAFSHIEEITFPAGIDTLGMQTLRKTPSLDKNGIFFRASAFQEEYDSSEGGETTDSHQETEIFVRVYDNSGNATVENTKAVINPAAITIKFQDSKGKKIADDINAVGAENLKLEDSMQAEGDHHYYTDYTNPFGYKAFETASIIEDNYYAKNREFTFYPIDIRGYVKPQAITKTILQNSEEVIFRYEAAEKLSLALDSPNLSTPDNLTEFPAGEEVKVNISEPPHKELSRLLLNGRDVTSRIETDGIDRFFKFTIEENSRLEAEFTDSNYDNTLHIEEPNDMKLGGTTDISATYRGRSLSLSSMTLTLNDASEQNALELTKDNTLKAMKAGDHNITVSVKNHPEMEYVIKLKVLPLKVYLRLEDDKNTVLPKTEIVVDSLYLKSGTNYYMDLKFPSAVPLLPLEKALKSLGVNTSDQSDFDCGIDGNWMSTLGSNLWKNINRSGSFLYTVNNVFANLGVGQQPINDGDNIVIFYDPNWQDSSNYGYFEKEDYEIFEGESISLKLLGISFNTPIKGVSGAKLEIKNTSTGETTLSDTSTNADGSANMQFDKAGTYEISAVVDDVPSTISRPFARVLVKPIKSVELLSEDTMASVSFSSPKDLRGISLIATKLDNETINSNDIGLKSGFRAFEIKMVDDTTGNEVPVNTIAGDEGSVRVRVNFKTPMRDYNKMSLYNLKDGKLIKHDVTISENYFEFDTSHLSTWIIGEENESSDVNDNNAENLDNTNGGTESNSNGSNASDNISDSTNANHGDEADMTSGNHTLLSDKERSNTGANSKDKNTSPSTGDSYREELLDAFVLMVLFLMSAYYIQMAFGNKKNHLK